MNFPVSAIVLAKNSEKRIGACLESLATFDEVVVMDSGSEDGTLSIASRFGNTRIFKSTLTGFGELRNLAIFYARNDWIFCIDSDEAAPPELLREMESLRLDPQKVYSIARENHYNGRRVRCCGWSPDRVLRLFNRRHTAFNSNLVHESLVIKGDTTIVSLKNALLHYPFSDASDLITKMQFYSTLYADQHAGAKASSPSKAVSRAVIAFLKNYFLQLGFLNGYVGLIISVSNANGVFYKYMKLHERNLPPPENRGSGENDRSGFSSSDDPDGSSNPGGLGGPDGSSDLGNIGNLGNLGDLSENACPGRQANIQ